MWATFFTIRQLTQMSRFPTPLHLFPLLVFDGKTSWYKDVLFHQILLIFNSNCYCCYRCQLPMNTINHVVLLVKKCMIHHLAYYECNICLQNITSALKDTVVIIENIQGTKEVQRHLEPFRPCIPSKY